MLHETSAYSQPTKTENLDPGKGEWLCIGAREVGKNVMLLAAMAKRQDVLRRTSTSSEVHQANGAYWYCCPGKSFGFSRNSRIDLKSADTEDTDGEYRLSWHLDSDSGGWRAGMKKNLVREAGTLYEKVVFYLKPSKTLSVEPSERFFIGRQVAFAETSAAESSNGAQFPCFTGTKVQKSANTDVGWLERSSVPQCSLAVGRGDNRARARVEPAGTPGAAQGRQPQQLLGVGQVPCFTASFTGTNVLTCLPDDLTSFGSRTWTHL